MIVIILIIINIEEINPSPLIITYIVDGFDLLYFFQQYPNF